MFETKSCEEIEALILDLASHDKQISQQAYLSLAGMGKAATAPLLTVLTDPNDQVRWLAAKALGAIGDPGAAVGLVKALEDEALQVRWRAAEDLVKLKRDGLKPLLVALRQHSDAVRLREGAHHVLRALVATSDLKEVVEPVLLALEAVEPMMAVPPAADSALRALRVAAVPNQS